MTKTLISIVGPTAIGKTALSISLANHFKTSIISCDSRQFFKEMQIGTAAPTSEELNAAQHYFIHNKSIHDDYNVGSFEIEALETLNELFKTNDTVIMVGGSGLYVDAVTKGLDDFPDVDKSIREELNEIHKTEGLTKLQELLKEKDPTSYNQIAIDNPHRVIRALEICIGANKPYSYYLTNKSKKRNFNVITIGINADRELIYSRINQRVDIMMKEGLLKEVKELKSKKHLNALNTVGYKEFFKYFEGEYNLEFAIEDLKKNTRRFAKRQLTWFKRNKDTIWFDYQTPHREIAAKIDGLLK